MEIIKRITKPVVIAIKREIERSGGNEVFFVGKINDIGMVTSVKAVSRGNENSVPVNFFESTEPGVLLHNHPSGNLTPSNADLAVATRANENGQGFYIINNSVTEVYAVMEPIIPKKLIKLNVKDCALYISNGGPFSKSSKDFEERLTQIELLKNIAQSFNENKIAAFEAGTGVGKSYAYLIPSMLWALENNERVIISTGTINLQQQLSEKDIPQAEKILGKKIKAVLVKGRQNYVCLRRLENISKEKDLFTTETDALEKISAWVKTTNTGSKSDLAFSPPESLWQRINSESDACMGLRCPFREKCFIMAVRREASDANIIVVNHHLLFADIESRMNGVGYDDAAVLPPYRRIIFDEAHGIETAATSFFSETINRFRIIKQINLLYRERRGAIAGYVFTLQALADCADKTQEIATAVKRIIETISALETASLSAMENDTTVRLYSKTENVLSPVLSLLTTLSTDINCFVAIVREIIDNIDDDDKTDNAYWETMAILRHLEDARDLCKDFPEWSEKPEKVFWMQKQRLPQDFYDATNPKKNKTNNTSLSLNNSVYITFTETPLDISSLMNAGVLEPMESVVCTSATLRIAQDFSFWLRRTGLSLTDPDRLLTGTFDSPFCYKQNVLFSVPLDAPLPTNIQFQSWIEKAIVRLVKASKGRTLVLFTSYESLKAAYNATRNYILEMNIALLKQGDDDRARLLERFKEDDSSVLYATDSFWQGIDVPGSSLSQVIIVKLPFPVPSDPVFAARSEEIEARGGSSFMELSIPEAVIKFRQGFGRLVRRGDDKGSVVVLDNRIIQKQYGKIFMNSIPETRTSFGALDEITQEIKSFLTDT